MKVELNKVEIETLFSAISDVQRSYQDPPFDKLENAYYDRLEALACKLNNVLMEIGD